MTRTEFGNPRLRRFGSGTALLLSGLATGLFAGGAHAQQAAGAAQVGPQRGELEEIVVTSRRFAESVQDAPLAINVMTSEFIRTNRVTTVDQVMALTPGATFTFFNKVNPEASIRGLQTATPGNATSESGVQLLVDEVVISKDFMRARPLFDLDRVEVLRGPQGTSFGRNASLGVVHFVTRRPTREFEAGLITTAGVRDLFEAEGYVSGPLTESLSARFAFNFDTNDGEMKSVSTGRGLDGTENFAFRASLLYEPTDRFSVFFKGEYFQDNDQAPVRRSANCEIPQILAADDPRRADFSVPNMPPFRISFQDSCNPFQTEISEGDFSFNREIWSLSAEVAWEVSPGITLTSITGYVEGKSAGRQDALGTPENILFQDNTNDGWTFTEELRIDNQASGDRLRWVAGAFFLSDKENRFEVNRFFQPNADGTGGFPFPRVPTEIVVGDQTGKTDPSFAFFGEASYDLTTDLTATLGGRWTRDKKSNVGSARGFGFAPILAGLEGCVTFPVCGSPENPAGFEPVRAARSFDRFTGKGSLEYQVMEDHMIYLLASQGWRSGGFQPDARTAASAEIPFEPERTLNFELGWKGDIARRLRFAVDVFWTRLKNTQVNQFIQAGDGFFQLFSNAGRVRSFGVEGEVTWVVTSDLRVGGTGAIFEAEFRDTELAIAAGQQPLDLSGTRPDGAAKWTATLFGAYDVHLPDGSFVTFRSDLTARSNIFDDVGELPDRARPSLTQLGAEIRWTSSNGQYDVSIWGRNLTEDVDILNIGPNQANSLQPPVQFGNRRQIGATVGFRF